MGKSKFQTIPGKGIHGGRSRFLKNWIRIRRPQVQPAERGWEGPCIRESSACLPMDGLSQEFSDAHYNWNILKRQFRKPSPSKKPKRNSENVPFFRCGHYHGRPPLCRRTDYAMEVNQINPWSMNQNGQTSQKFKRIEDHVRDPVMPWRFQPITQAPIRQLLQAVHQTTARERSGLKEQLPPRDPPDAGGT